MFSKFDDESKKALLNAKKEMKELKHPYVGSEHLLLAILKNKSSNACKILEKYKVNYEKFKKELINVIGIGKESNEWYLYTPLLKRVIEEAIIISRENNENEVTLEHILTALFEEGEGVAVRILLCMKVDIDDLYNQNNVKKNKKILKSKKTLLIEEYGYNMNERAKTNEVDPVVGREKEIERIIEILGRRTKNNPLLIGDAGVGKTAIVEELSSRIINGLVPDKLKNKRIISVSMSSLISGTKYRGEFEERINKILKEIELDDTIILFIDEIHTLVGAGGAEGAIDASNILKPFMARGKIKLIGATTTLEYKKYLEDDRALERRFQTVLIEEPSKEKTLEILKKINPIYESYHNVKISEEVLTNIVNLTDKYIHNRKQPDKSIDILDEVASKVSIKKDKIQLKLEKLEIKYNEIINKKNQAILRQDFNMAGKIKENQNDIEKEINIFKERVSSKSKRKEVKLEEVAEVVKLKSNIPIYEIIKEDTNKLKNLNKMLKNKISGQDKIIDELCKGIKKIKYGYKNEKRPASYIFVGPSGVGKTYLAKELANLTEGKEKFIRLDMSEYREEHSISKIIGSPPGYVGFSNKNTILDEVKMNPNAIILLDEIERAHSSVRNLLLQILDEGELKSSTGEVITFYNNIVIMTSNIGHKNNRVGFFNENYDANITNLNQELGIEIVNRIDKVLVFNSLNEKIIRNIVKQQIKKIENEFKEKIQLKIKSNVIEQIIKESKYEQYGARKIEKIIKDKIYDIVIDEIVNKNVNILIETI